MFQRPGNAGGHPHGAAHDQPHHVLHTLHEEDDVVPEDGGLGARVAVARPMAHSRSGASGGPAGPRSSPRSPARQVPTGAAPSTAERRAHRRGRDEDGDDEGACDDGHGTALRHGKARKYDDSRVASMAALGAALPRLRDSDRRHYEIQRDQARHQLSQRELLLRHQQQMLESNETGVASPSPPALNRASHLIEEAAGGENPASGSSSGSYTSSGSRQRRRRRPETDGGISDGSDSSPRSRTSLDLTSAFNRVETVTPFSVGKRSGGGKYAKGEMPQHSFAASDGASSVTLLSPGPSTGPRSRFAEARSRSSGEPQLRRQPHGSDSSGETSPMSDTDVHILHDASVSSGDLSDDEVARRDLEGSWTGSTGGGALAAAAAHANGLARYDSTASAASAVSRSRSGALFASPLTRGRRGALNFDQVADDEPTASDGSAPVAAAPAPEPTFMSPMRLGDGTRQPAPTHTGGKPAGIGMTPITRPLPDQSAFESGSSDEEDDEMMPLGRTPAQRTPAPPPTPARTPAWAHLAGSPRLRRQTSLNEAKTLIEISPSPTGTIPSRGSGGSIVSTSADRGAAPGAGPGAGNGIGATPARPVAAVDHSLLDSDSDDEPASSRKVHPGMRVLGFDGPDQSPTESDAKSGEPADGMTDGADAAGRDSGDEAGSGPAPVTVGGHHEPHGDVPHATHLHVGHAGERFTFASHFEYVRDLGRGSFYSVVEARDKETGDHYAIKKTQRQFRSTRDRDLYLGEVRAYVRVGRHDNVVQCHRAWQENGHLFVQLELCPRGSLRDLMMAHPQGAAIPESAIMCFLSDLAAGLCVIHEAGLVHLDIKPENAFINAEGRLKIGDFGMAREAGGSEDGVEGDNRYMAPELLTSSGESPAADIFSLGISIFELVWDVAVPKDGHSWRRLRDGHLPSLPARARLAGRSEFLVDLVKSMMSPKPEERPTAAQLCDMAEVREARSTPNTFVTEVPMRAASLSRIPRAARRMMDRADSYVSAEGLDIPDEIPPLREEDADMHDGDGDEGFLVRPGSRGPGDLDFASFIARSRSFSGMASPPTVTPTGQDVTYDWGN